MSILFINGSPNKNGNTAALAAELLKDHEFQAVCSWVRRVFCGK